MDYFVICIKYHNSTLNLHNYDIIGHIIRCYSGVLERLKKI